MNYNSNFILLLRLIFKLFTYLNDNFKVIKESIESNWVEINYFENVLLIITIPTEYSESDMYVMRECVYKACLIEDMHSEQLQFITECKWVLETKALIN